MSFLPQIICGKKLPCYNESYMTVRDLFRKGAVILLLVTFLSASGIALLHHHEDKSPSDICNICDFAKAPFASIHNDIVIVVDFTLLPLIVIYFISYKYRLSDTYRNKSPPRLAA